MAFYVGQKVVCIRGASVWLTEGNHYTVIATGLQTSNFGRALDAIEIDVPGPAGNGIWDATRFRPIVEPKTDISIFTAMLTPKKATEPA